MAAEYNLYGDPKFGVVAPPPAAGAGDAAATAAASEEPPSSVEVVVPDFQVQSTNGIDYVTIPDGMMLWREGEPQVPYYTTAVHYPQGYRVQEVTLAETWGDETFSDLNLPLTTFDIYAAPQGSVSSLEPGGGWYPGTDYDWRVVGHPDGSSTLAIQIYAFQYRPLSGEALFTQNYRFDIGYTTTPVSILELSTDRAAYDPGELVRVDLALTNEGEAQDVVVRTTIRRYSLGDKVDGLPLRTLHDLRGEAAFSAYWSSEGVEPGPYAAVTTLLDTAGNILDRQSATFQVGRARAQVTELTAEPEVFEVGEPVSITLILSSTGTTEISGTVVIQVQNEAGEAVHRFQHQVSDLAPGQSAKFDDAWDTTGVEKGTYAIVGYALHDSTATEPKTASVRARRRVHLPLVRQP